MRHAQLLHHLDSLTTVSLGLSLSSLANFPEQQPCQPTALHDFANLTDAVALSLVQCFPAKLESYWQDALSRGITGPVCG